MIENVSTQLTVFHCFAHCLLPGRAFASLYALLILEKEAEIGGRVIGGANSVEQISTRVHICPLPLGANCAHERNLLSHMYNLILDFDKLPIFSI